MEATVTTTTTTTTTVAVATLSAFSINQMVRAHLRRLESGRGCQMTLPQFCKFIARLTGAKIVDSTWADERGIFAGCLWGRKWETPQGVKFGWHESGTAAWDGPRFLWAK